MGDVVLNGLLGGGGTSTVLYFGLLKAVGQQARPASISPFLQKYFIRSDHQEWAAAMAGSDFGIICFNACFSLEGAV